MDTEEIKKQNADPIEEENLGTLQSTDFGVGLKIIGWIYFFMSLIGGIILISNSHSSGGYYDDYVSTTNYVTQALGIAGVITSLIVLLICIGIARIIEQNAYIIKSQLR